MKLQFSGHESFICKHFWLKKGYDYIVKNNDFNSESAVIGLGVGKNMVTSINYWLKSFGMLDSNNLRTELADKIFDEIKGYDPYIENLATVWLLHYSLIKTNKASVYSLFFNEFRKGRTDFTKEQFLSYIKRMLEGEGQKNINANTVNNDISVFIRNYLKPSYKETKIDIEEDFSSLMIDLDLMKSYKAENAEGKIVEWYKVENSIQIDLPPEVVLFSILDNDTYGKSISFKDLLVGPNSPGNIFTLNEEGLYQKLNTIVKNTKGLTYTETAGIRELQIKSSINKWDILNGYYKG
jgi:Protein of unknown function (DUF4007)